MGSGDKPGPAAVLQVEALHKHAREVRVRGITLRTVGSFYSTPNYCKEDRRRVAEREQKCPS